MNAHRAAGRISIACALTFIPVGCRHPTQAQVEILPLARLRTEAIPKAHAGGRVAEIAYALPQFKPPDIDLKWLDADEFVPPGATVISRSPARPGLHPTPKARYPSTEECISADSNAVVGLSSDRRRSDLHHRLLLYQRGDAASKTVFHTSNTFEVLWSADSEHVAVTEFTGKNSSDVLIINRRGGAIASVDLRPLLAWHLREAFLEAPRFQKAYRWSDGPFLMVRGLGRIAVPPYEQFGYEVLIDARRLDDPMSFELLTAFTRIPPVKKEPIAGL